MSDKRAGYVAHVCLLGALGVLASVSPPMPGNPAVCACQAEVDNPGGEVLDTVNDTLDNWREKHEQHEQVERDSGIVGYLSSPVTLVQE